MRNHRTLAKSVIVSFMLFPAAGIAFGQAEPPELARVDLPEFYFDAIVFAGGDTGRVRLDLYIQVPYSALRFLQGEGGYDASYEETVSIQDADNNLVSEKVTTERIHKNEFAETMDPARYHVTQRFISLTPGRYTLAVQIRDEETRKSVRSKREVLVRPMSGEPLMISDLMLVNHLRLEGDKKIIVPNIRGNVGGLPDGFYLFCEVYNEIDCDTLELVYQVRTAKDEERLKERFFQPAVRGRNQLFVKINSASLPMGTYTVGLQAVACSNDEKLRRVTPVIFHPFVIRWSGMPAAIEDLDAAVNQATYAADGNELEHIKSAPTQDEKKKRFQEFWKKRDPSPNSERNEAMEQYYGRVAFANKNFSHYSEGWKTDRGMVYILFGSPSNIDRHPFESDAKPYEVWHYNDLNYRFLFIDLTGFGDFRLDPSTPLWNIKNRRR